MQHKCQKMDCNRKALGTRLRCVGKAVQNGGTFHTFCGAEKITQLLPKINARTGGIQVDERHLLFGEYLQKYTPLSPERAEKHANEGGNYLF